MESGLGLGLELGLGLGLGLERDASRLSSLDLRHRRRTLLQRGTLGCRVGGDLVHLS